MRFALVLLFLFAVGARPCGSSPGEPCERSGDGFTSSDPCQTDCLDWESTCPDGTPVTPAVCTYSECNPADMPCDGGQVCVQANVDRWFCVDEGFCR